MASQGFLESKWRANARRLQLEFSSAPHAFFLTGRRGDLPVSITVDHGSNEALLEVELRRTPGLDMRLVREGFGAKFSKLTGAQEIQIGDPKFDPVFLIQGMEPGAVREFLTPERKNALLQFIKAYPSAEITHASINVTQKADMGATEAEKILGELGNTAVVLDARGDAGRPSTVAGPTPEPTTSQTQKDPQRARLYEALSQGFNPFDPVLIASVLHRLGPMITEVSAEQFTGVMGNDLAEYGSARPEQLEPTEFSRIDGVAAVFTHNDLSKPASDTGGATLWLQSSWPRGLALLLERADGEVIIDHGAPHALRLSADHVSRLLAVFEGKALAAVDALYVVIGQNGSVFGTLDQNRRKSILVYDSEADATAVLGELRSQAGQQLTLKSLPILTALGELLRGPHEQVVVNHGLRTAHVYNKDDLAELLEVAKRLRR